MHSLNWKPKVYRGKKNKWMEISKKITGRAENGWWSRLRNELSSLPKSPTEEITPQWTMLTHCMVFLSNTDLLHFSLQQFCETGVSFSSFCAVLMIRSLNISPKGHPISKFQSCLWTLALFVSAADVPKRCAELPFREKAVQRIYVTVPGKRPELAGC